MNPVSITYRFTGRAYGAEVSQESLDAFVTSREFTAIFASTMTSAVSVCTNEVAEEIPTPPPTSPARPTCQQEGDQCGGRGFNGQPLCCDSLICTQLSASWSECQPIPTTPAPTPVWTDPPTPSPTLPPTEYVEPVPTASPTPYPTPW